MIDIRQLKCGSRVLVDGQRVKVCGVTRRKVGYHHSDDRPNANLRYARVNEAEPIAITPDCGCARMKRYDKLNRE